MKKKIVFITFYDTICYGTRLLSSLATGNGLESYLVMMKKEIQNVPIFSKKDEYQSYQYFYNGLLRGSQFAVGPISKTEEDQLLCILENIAPSIICLSTRSFAYDICKRLFPKIKKKFSKVPIVAGGWGPTLEPEKFLEFSDFVCFGEGEKAIVGICEALKEGKSLEDIPNLIYRKNNQLIRNKVKYAISVEELNKLPFPDFSVDRKYLITNNKLHIGKTFYNTKVYDCFATRGCPLNCTYCLSSKYSIIYKKYSGKTCPKIRLRDINVVLEEIRLAKARGAKLIRIKDEVFPFNSKWVKEFIVRYPKEIGLPFFAYLRPEFHDVDTIRGLKEAGLFITMVGIQSGSKQIRKEVYKRKLPKNKIVDFAKALYKLNIQYTYHFIYRNPFERENHLEESLDFTYRLPYSSSIIYKLEPFSGSPIKNMIDLARPTPIPNDTADWYAILHCMSLENALLRKLSKLIRKYKLFKRVPIVLSIFFLPSLIKEGVDLIKNTHLLNASISYFSFEHKERLAE